MLHVLVAESACAQIPLQGGPASTIASILRTPPFLLLMPHPILGIDELLRLIIDELMEDSQPTVLSLALTCRSLEEPGLSSLWKTQRELTVLLEVLPNHTWYKDEQGINVIVSCRDFLAQHPVYILPGDRGRSFNGGMGQAATIRFLDAWIAPRVRKNSP